MLLVPRLQTLMVGADGDGMEGYVPSPFPESHDDGIRLLFTGVHVRLWPSARTRLQKATGRCLPSSSTCSNTAPMA